MAGPGKLDRFDRYVPREPWVNPWQADGSYLSDVEMLTDLLQVAVGTSQRSGVVAGAVDVWAAEELRRSGFDPDEVWPRRSPPRVLPRDLRNFVDRGLTKQLRTDVQARYDTPGAKQALPSEAHVMGRAYSKQSDVVIASWAAGLEVLISTKTMLSSYQKNLRNRFEEGYGDAKNIRGRHPLAALGFLFIAGSDIPSANLDFAVDMLHKLTSEVDVYDCACLLVIEGAQGTHEDAGRAERSVEDEPSALLQLLARDSADPLEDGTIAEEDVVASGQPAPQVTVHLDAVPPDLGPNAFFHTLITRALDRMPVLVYPRVRSRREAASG